MPMKPATRLVLVPDGASTFRRDLSDVVNCAECGHAIVVVESFTSPLIHNDLGFGYAVCPRCYEAELGEMGVFYDL